MTAKELQQHPVIFWLLAAITVLSLAYAVWTNIHNQPSRELSYALKRQRLIDLDKIGNINLNLQGRNFTTGQIYLNQLFIWNSGNQEISEQDYGAPLQLQFGSEQVEPRMVYYGIQPDYVVGDLVEGFRFKKLFPKSGMKVIYFASGPSTGLSIVGSLIGGTPGTSGIVNRTYSERERDFILYWLGIAGVIALLIFVYLYRQNKSASRTERIVESLLPAIGSVAITGMIFLVLYQLYNSPPFS